MTRRAERVVVGLTGTIGVIGVHAHLLRLLADGLDLSVIMTGTAARFLAPAALGAVIGLPVLADAWQPGRALAPAAVLDGASVLVVAPASATTIGYCAAGLAANLVSACYLAHRGQTIVAPSMGPEMLAHPAVRRNLAQLAADGACILPTGRGVRAADQQWSDGALCHVRTLSEAVREALAAAAAADCTEAHYGVG